MEGLKEEKVSLTEAIATRIAQWAADPEVDHLKYLKVKLGLETIFINISKGAVIYAVALIFGIFWQVAVFNLSYYAIRKYAGGYHLPDSFFCTLFSVIAFIGLPYLATMYTLPYFAVPFMYLVSVLILYLYAPYISKKNGDIYGKGGIKLRNKSIILCLILLSISLLLQNETYQTLLTTGATLASLLTVHRN